MIFDREGLEKRMRRKERTRKLKKIVKKYSEVQPVDKRIITVEDELYVIEENEAKKAPKIPKVLERHRENGARDRQQGLESDERNYGYTLVTEGQ